MPFPPINNLSQTILKTIVKNMETKKEQLLNKVKNSAANGEIIQFEQFLILTKCYRKNYAAETSESVCMWIWVNPFRHAYCICGKGSRFMVAERRL